MNITEKINKICFELEDLNCKINLVNTIDSSEELYRLLDFYNWDDGFKIPITILQHSKCLLGVAIKMYWLAEADIWNNSDLEIDAYNKEHYDFSRLISEKILKNQFPIGDLSHSENFSKVQLYKFKKEDFPEIFYLPVVGSNT